MVLSQKFPPLGLAVGDDGLGPGGREAGHPLEQVLRAGGQVDAHKAHALAHHLVQALRQLGLQGKLKFLLLTFSIDL